MGGSAQHHAPLTATHLLIGCVAISGIPPLGGLLEQDEIPRPGLQTPSPLLWAVGFPHRLGMTALHVRLYSHLEGRSEAPMPL